MQRFEHYAGIAVDHHKQHPRRAFRLGLHIGERLDSK